MCPVGPDPAHRRWHQQPWASAARGGDGHWEWIRSKNCHPATVRPFSYPLLPRRRLFVVRARADAGALPAHGHVEAATASTALPPGSAQWAPGWPGGEQEFGMTPPHLKHCLLSLVPHPVRGEPLRPPSQHHPVLHPQPFTRPRRLPSHPLGLSQAAPRSPSPGTAGLPSPGTAGWQSWPPQ